MKIEANSIEEFFLASGDKEDDLRNMDRVISKLTPHLERKLFSIPSITLLGYGEMPWNTSTVKDGVWPIIALAPQKNNISLYISVYKDGKTIPEIYNKKLGKVSCGKSCVRFKTVEDLNLDVLEQAIGDAVEWARDFKGPNS